MLPSIASLLVQFIPPPVTVNVPAPGTGALNRVNLSPITSAGPRLLTVTVPAPVLLKVPLTNIVSLDRAGDRDLLTRANILPFKVRSLLTVSVPIAAAEPPPMAPPVCTDTGHTTMPEPARVPLLIVVSPV